MGLLERLKAALGLQPTAESAVDPGEARTSYEYKCLQCHSNFTSPDKQAQAQCPECGSVKVRGGSPTVNVGDISVDKDRY
jgi:DNA-directed RNA polymerase subunit RPC12/RpoP